MLDHQTVLTVRHCESVTICFGEALLKFEISLSRALALHFLPLGSLSQQLQSFRRHGGRGQKEGSVKVEEQGSAGRKKKWNTKERTERAEKKLDFHVVRNGTSYLYELVFNSMFGSITLVQNPHKVKYIQNGLYQYKSVKYKVSICHWSNISI